LDDPIWVTPTFPEKYCIFKLWQSLGGSKTQGISINIGRPYLRTPTFPEKYCIFKLWQSLGGSKTREISIKIGRPYLRTSTFPEKYCIFKLWQSLGVEQNTTKILDKHWATLSAHPHFSREILHFQALANLGGGAKNENSR